MTRILAVADEVDEFLYGDKLQTLRPGNHDPSLRPADTTWAPLQQEPWAWA